MYILSAKRIEIHAHLVGTNMIRAHRCFTMDFMLMQYIMAQLVKREIIFGNCVLHILVLADIITILFYLLSQCGPQHHLRCYALWIGAFADSAGWCTYIHRQDVALLQTSFC